MPSTNNQTGVKKSSGTIWMNTGNWTGVSFSVSTGAGSELAGMSTAFTLSPIGHDFEMSSDGRLKYTGIKTKDFIIKGYVAQSSLSTTSLRVAKNGVLVPGAEVFGLTALINRNTPTPVTLATNDYVSLNLARASPNTVTIYQVTLSVTSLN